MNICNTLALSLVVGILSLLGCGGALSSAAYTNTNDEQLIFQQQQKPPLRVFILVGQSNMVGHGARYDIDESTGQQKNATLQWLVDNVPDRFGMLKVKQPNVDVNVEVGVRSGKSGKTTRKKRSDNSEWTVRNDVLMACNSRGFDDLSSRVTDYGKLYAGLCAGEPPKTYDQVGPELGFGWSVGDAFNNGKSDTGGEDNDNKILLLKVAWGGKSLAVDFRPPSSGGTTGPNYISMIDTIKSTMASLGQIFPEEVADNRVVHLSGFAWHQGWNDGCNEEMANEYEHNLANFIRDVRHDLNIPDLPFAIANSGMIGYDTTQPSRREDVINAEMKVATYPEFQGSVASVDTRPFARPPAPSSPSDQIYHWYWNAESYWLIGQSLGNVMIDLVKQREQRQEVVTELY